MKNLIKVILAFSFYQINNGFEIKSRIVGGNEAKLGQFPYFAYLRIFFADFSAGSCGASLISDEWILTAAHCLVEAESVNIFLGETQLNSPESGHMAIFVDKFNFHIHPDYKPETVFDDIGLYSFQVFISDFNEFNSTVFLYLLQH